MGRSRVLLQSDPELEVRVLVVLASADYKPYYIPLMNTICSAEHLGVCIDCVNVSTHGSKFMQQACHQTGGTYQHLDGEPKRDRALLQHMMCTFASACAVNTHGFGVRTRCRRRASCFQDGSEVIWALSAPSAYLSSASVTFKARRGKQSDVCKSFFKLRPRARPGKRRAKGQGKSGGGVSRTKEQETWARLRAPQAAPQGLQRR